MLTVVTSERFADHITPPGHPERAERADVMQAIAGRWAARGGSIAAPRAASDADLARVHEAAYLESITRVRGRAAMLDPDTYTSPDSDEVARLAAGAVLTGVDRVLDAPAGHRAFVLVRPPGHHAEADRAMGFCLYNNVAVGAAWARARGLSRVAVVDFDVHHGNGTQWMFYEDPSVLFVSSHQFPFYPGTGAAHETGRGDGVGFTVNVPLEAGCGDVDFDRVYRSLVIPVLQEFRPELLLLSAGFDAHERDPLAGMQVTTAGFRRIIGLLLQAADELCEGRAVFITEGGYDARALGECCQAVIDLAAAPLEPPVALTAASPLGDAAIRAVHRAQAGHWRALR